MEKVKIRLLFFGITHDITNCREREEELSDGATVATLRDELMKTYPGFRELRSFAVAVNEEYAAEDVELKERDVVAIIPPVSGG